MRNYKKMPEPGPSHAIGPGQGRPEPVSAVGPAGHSPATMIVLSPAGAHMEPLVPHYHPQTHEERVVRVGGTHAGKVAKAGRP